MSKTKKSSNAQFTSAGKGLTVIGNHCYAYSGSITVTSTPSTTLLDFHTGKGYMIVELQPSYFTLGTGEDAYFQTFINGIQIRNDEIGSSTAERLPSELIILIPPLSHFEVTSYTASADRLLGVTLTGEVYG